MKCPFCGKEIEPKETVAGNRIEHHCPRCGSLIAAYLKDMYATLKGLFLDKEGK